MDRIFPNDYINQIFQSDCLDLMKELPDGAVSLILTDSPYGIQYQNQFAAGPHPILEGIWELTMDGFPEKATAFWHRTATLTFSPDLTVTSTTISASKTLGLQ